MVVRQMCERDHSRFKSSNPDYEMHKPRDENYSAFPKNQDTRRRRVIRNLDRVAAALISFACIYSALFITVDFRGYSVLYGPWSICGIPLVVSVLLINVPWLTNQIWKLWLVAFAANLVGVLVMLLPLFNLVIHMHEI